MLHFCYEVKKHRQDNALLREDIEKVKEDIAILKAKSTSSVMTPSVRRRIPTDLRVSLYYYCGAYE